MAEALLKEALKDKRNYKVSSAGLGAMIGHKPDKIVCELMLEKNLDISEYRGKQINTQMIHGADLILVMESKHKELIEHNEPSAKGKVFRLGEWSDFDISDPYQKEREVFLEILQLIEKSVKDWVSKI